MTADEKFMQRCLDLAALGIGNVAPNPMVGSVVVHKGRIIGEGYHMQYGKAHAEVNAINAVQEKELLKESTIYVNLEPCAHFAKTPPCSDLIIASEIPHVVIGCIDSYSEVAGKGIERMKKADIKVCMTDACDTAIFRITLSRYFMMKPDAIPEYALIKIMQT